MPGDRRPLRRSRHTEAYRRRLREAWAELCIYVQTQFGHILREGAPAPSRRIDSYVSSFVEHCYARGLARHRAVNAALAVQRRLRLDRRQLANTWEALWTWRLRAPGRTRRPLPRTLWEALVVVLMAKAMASTGVDAMQWAGVAVMVAVSFDALLRLARLV